MDSVLSLVRLNQRWLCHGVYHLVTCLAFAVGSLLAPANAKASPLVCADVFMGPNTDHTYTAEDTIAAINWQHYDPIMAESYVRDSSGTVILLFRKTTTRLVTANSYFDSKTAFLKDSGSGVSSSLELDSNDLQGFRFERDRALDFVIGIYRERRAHWSESFLLKLRTMAAKFEKQSTYITAEKRPLPTYASFDAKDQMSDGPRQVIASIRLIEEVDGTLPMETYLGIRVKTDPGVVKIEPGNYAILPSETELGSIQTAIEILAHLQRYKRETGKSSLYLTYADSYSQKLYSLMGFKPISPELMSKDDDTSFKTTLRGGITIEKEGVEWMPMYADEAMMKDMMLKKLSRIAKQNGGVGFNDVSLYHSFEKAIQKSAAAMVASPQARRLQVTDSFGHSKAMKKLDLRIWKNELWQTISISHANSPGTVAELQLPLNLKENDAFTTDDGYFVRYFGGELHAHKIVFDNATRSETATSLILKIDSHLNRVESGSISTLRNQKIVQEIKFRAR